MSAASAPITVKSANEPATGGVASKAAGAILFNDVVPSSGLKEHVYTSKDGHTHRRRAS